MMELRACAPVASTCLCILKTKRINEGEKGCLPGQADDGLWGLESSGSNGQKVMGGGINRMDRGAEIPCYAL